MAPNCRAAILLAIALDSGDLSRIHKAMLLMWNLLELWRRVEVAADNYAGAPRELCCMAEQLVELAAS